jgi:NAD(P)H-quinone oxidoreductase subunit 4
LYPKIMTDTYISSIDGLVKRDLLAVERIRGDRATIMSHTNLSIGTLKSPLLD